MVGRRQLLQHVREALIAAKLAPSMRKMLIEMLCDWQSKSCQVTRLRRYSELCVEPISYVADRAKACVGVVAARVSHVVDSLCH